jgi:hypothetical protein
MPFKIDTSGLPLQWDQIEGTFKVIVNVSDRYDLIDHQKAESKDIRYHWFPMNEHSEMGFNSLVGALNILYIAQDKLWPVLVHCEHGKNRSVMVKETYEWMATDFDPDFETPVLDKNCDGMKMPVKTELRKMLTKFRNHLVYPGGFHSWLDLVKESYRW